MTFISSRRVQPEDRLLVALGNPALSGFDIDSRAYVAKGRVDARIIVSVRLGLWRHRIVFTPLAAALMALRLESEWCLAHRGLYAVALKRAVQEAEHRIELVHQQQLAATQPMIGAA